MKRVFLSFVALICCSVFANAQLPVGSKAPRLDAKEWFNEPKGLDLTDLDNLHGRVVFIEFWATW
jgi:hypothetical protein